MKDPGIVLFGKKIGWPETPNLPPVKASSEERDNTEEAIACSSSGRRKKKTSPSHCRYIISQEALETAAANHIKFALDSMGFHPKSFPSVKTRPVFPPGYPPFIVYPPPYWSSVSWLPPAGSILGKHSLDGEYNSNSDDT
ncbi:hypothetical protein L1987_72744 [Smallanthus sonchifolius]|uniref:Uncharacterized protein n=1 Tax=Smallanthus sonchifolius TaxID=185202 RepID=A0ACB9AVG7_9ASTR|nr:hypothetical protein L1987_72744 [Smallanthus sonchifolius]